MTTRLKKFSPLWPKRQICPQTGGSPINKRLLLQKQIVSLVISQSQPLTLDCKRWAFIKTFSTLPLSQQPIIQRNRKSKRRSRGRANSPRGKGDKRPGTEETAVGELQEGERHSDEGESGRGEPFGFGGTSGRGEPFGLGGTGRASRGISGRISIEAE